MNRLGICIVHVSDGGEDGARCFLHEPRDIPSTSAASNQGRGDTIVGAQSARG